MKFERLTNEEFVAKKAGFVPDKSFDRQFDYAAWRQFKRHIGIKAFDIIMGQYDGDLYKGDDGNYYAVVFDVGPRHSNPAIWQRMKKVEAEIEEN